MDSENSDEADSLYANLFAPGLLAQQIAARLIAKDEMYFESLVRYTPPRHRLPVKKGRE